MKHVLKPKKTIVSQEQEKLHVNNFIEEPDEVEEPEEIELLADLNLEAENLSLEIPEIPPVNFTAALNLLANPIINSVLLDKNFFIRHTSVAVYKFFEHYCVIENESFFNVFCKSVEKEKLNTMLKNLKDLEKGFLWSGILLYKTKYYKTIYVKTNIFPLFEAGDLIGYWVVFEDITDSYFAQYKNMLHSLLNASKLKDNDTGYHNERLNYYSKELTEAMFATNKFPQIDADFVHDISLHAAVHDIGKIGTPDYILQKKGSLSDDEWKIMKEHTINGPLILGVYPILMAKEIALSHHEKWDGTGYPYKLAGDMIPLSARIVAVADVYDALRMKRSYKEAMSHGEAVNLILQGAGGHFDPDIIKVFKTMHSCFNEIWEKNKDKVLR